MALALVVFGTIECPSISTNNGKIRKYFRQPYLCPRLTHIVTFSLTTSKIIKQFDGLTIRIMSVLLESNGSPENSLLRTSSLKLIGFYFFAVLLYRK